MREKRIFMWDCETYLKGEERAHTMYNVGYAEYINKEMTPIMELTDILSSKLNTEYVYPTPKDGHPHIVYDNVSLKTHDSIAMNIISYTDVYQNLYDRVTIHYGLDAEEKFIDDIIVLAEGVRQKVAMELDKWSRRFRYKNRNNLKMTEEEFNQAIKSQRTRLVRRFKIIFYAHNAGKYDTHFMLKKQEIVV